MMHEILLSKMHLHISICLTQLLSSCSLQMGKRCVRRQFNCWFGSQGNYQPARNVAVKKWWTTFSCPGCSLHFVPHSSVVTQAEGCSLQMGKRCARRQSNCWFGSQDSCQHARNVAVLQWWSTFSCSGFLLRFPPLCSQCCHG